jgi:hypothetical protein
MRPVSIIPLVLTGCLSSVPVQGSGCPCPDGYQCCAATMQCLAAGVSCPAPTDPAGGTGGATPPRPGDQPASAPLLRLTVREYRNTIRDLLGEGSAVVAGDFFVDYQGSSGFHVGAAVVSAGDANQFLRASERLARTAIGNLPAFLPARCTPVPASAADQDGCAVRFIRDFGLRAFRRPLAADEVEALRALYATARTNGVAPAFADGIRVLMTAMLQSPFFLYRWEGSVATLREGPLVRLDPYQTASRLSYGLWASMPDPTLFVAAASGELADPDHIVQQARRLLADPRARDSIAEFHLQWLGLSDLPQQVKDPTFSDFNAAVARAMLDETSAFAASVFSGPQATGKLEALLTSSATFLGEDLAAIYQVGGLTGPELRPVTLDPARRSGIFTQASFLATYADDLNTRPIMRGTVLLDSTLCLDLADVVNVAIPELPDRRPDQTTREWYDALQQVPCTAGCHALIGVGDAFENYDAVGAYRTVDSGKPIDAAGKVALSPGETLTYRDAVDLTHQLVGRDDVHRCMARQWLRYLVRRRDGSGDDGSLREAGDAFDRSAQDLRELIVALTRTRAFTHRQLAPGEVMP